MTFFFGLICFCNWISASTSENGCEREESTWVNEWLAVCLMWRWMKEWGNGACQSFFSPSCQKVGVIQELADRCLLSALICRIQEQRRDYPGTAFWTLQTRVHWQKEVIELLSVQVLYLYLLYYTIFPLYFCSYFAPVILYEIESWLVHYHFIWRFFLFCYLVCLFKKVSSVSFLLFNEHNNRTVKLGEVRFSLFAND